MAGKVGLDAEVRAAPVTEVFHQRNQFAAFPIQGIGHLRGNRCGGRPAKHTIAFELAELVGEDLLGNLRKSAADFGKAPRAEGEMPEDLDLPFAGKDVDGSLNGTAVVIFHEFAAVEFLQAKS